MINQGCESIEIVGQHTPDVGNVRLLRFSDSRTGCAIALNRLIVTFDGGGRWHERYPLGLDNPYLAPQVVVPVGKSLWWMLSTYAGREIICFKSVDGAHTWVETNRFSATHYNIINQDICFVDSTHGWLLIVEGRRPRYHSRLYRTEDAGYTWLPVQFHARFRPQRLVFADSYRGWIPEIQTDSFRKSAQNNSACHNRWRDILEARRLS